MKKCFAHKLSSVFDLNNAIYNFIEHNEERRLHSAIIEKNYVILVILCVCVFRVSHNKVPQSIRKYLKTAPASRLMRKTSHIFCVKTIILRLKFVRHSRNSGYSFGVHC